MISTLAQMGFVILCGVGWRIIRPAGLPADQLRSALTGLVFNLLMPALVLAVLWKTPLSIETLKISAFGIAVIALGITATWLLSRLIPIEAPRLGAAMLAIGFPNVTYLGLPLLEQIFGPWARTIVIQIDLFASMPSVLILGAMIGQHYGLQSSAGIRPAFKSLLVNPPLWAAIGGVFLNQTGIMEPAWLNQTLERMAAGIIPLMLVSLGLGLNLRSLHQRNLTWASIALATRLGLVPLAALKVGLALNFHGDTLTALILEAAMPSMLFGVVYCDRYRLDTGFYSMVVALTTMASMVSLPYWHQVASHL